MLQMLFIISFFFFNDTATTEIYTLSLHDALPIYLVLADHEEEAGGECPHLRLRRERDGEQRSEEHTSELQSLAYLVCRLLLEKKKKNMIEMERAKVQRLCSSSLCNIREMCLSRIR